MWFVFIGRGVNSLDFIFFSPELSSERDIAILLSVRRPESVVRCPPFLFGAYLGNSMHWLDDISWVGEARAKDVHAEFWMWHMLIKYLIYIIYSKSLDILCPEHISGSTIFSDKVGIGPKVCCIFGMAWIKGILYDVKKMKAYKHILGTVCPILMIFGDWVGLEPKVCPLLFGRGINWIKSDSIILKK